MIKFLYLFTIFFVCCIYSADSLPKFIRGRLFNRNNLQSKLLTNVPDQYFEQRLDHFDESTTDTWQQVLNFSIYFYKINLNFLLNQALLDK